MTSAGLTIMIVSVGAVTALFVWCLWRVLRLPHPEELAKVEPVSEDKVDQR